MEEIRRLEKELVEAKERNMRCNLRWHNEVHKEKAKVETLEKQMGKFAQKASGSIQERGIALEELYVSGGEEELEFRKATPSINIRNLMRKEAAQGGVTERQGCV